MDKMPDIGISSHAVCRLRAFPVKSGGSNDHGLFIYLGGYWISGLAHMQCAACGLFQRNQAGRTITGYLFIWADTGYRD
jgi:hypothetical protein